MTLGNLPDLRDVVAFPVLLASVFLAHPMLLLPVPLALPVAYLGDSEINSTPYGSSDKCTSYSARAHMFTRG